MTTFSVPNIHSFFRRGNCHPVNVFLVWVDLCIQWLATIRLATHSSLLRRLECVAWRIVASHCVCVAGSAYLQINHWVYWRETWYIYGTRQAWTLVNLCLIYVISGPLIGPADPVHLLTNRYWIGLTWNLADVFILGLPRADYHIILVMLFWNLAFSWPFPGLWLVNHFPCICRQTTDYIHFSETWKVNSLYEFRGWLTDGHSQLNSCCFLVKKFLLDPCFC